MANSRRKISIATVSIAIMLSSFTAGLAIGQSTAKPDFEDVDDVPWAWEAISWAQDQGITAGISDTEFGPDDNLNRAQMITFLCRALRPDLCEPATEVEDVGTSSVGRHIGTAPVVDIEYCNLTGRVVRVQWQYSGRWGAQYYVYEDFTVVLFDAADNEIVRATGSPVRVSQFSTSGKNNRTFTYSAIIEQSEKDALGSGWTCYVQNAE